MRRLVLATVLAAIALPAAAPAYPPTTCGRTTVNGKPYVVRTHGPTCSFATKWVRQFMLHHTSPAHFTCKAYGAAVPAHCVRNGKKGRWFNATKP
jgi:hypothetical protein